MKVVLIAAAILVVVLIIGLKLIPTALEPLTELYFENHTALPKTVVLDENVSFSFTIHNLEYKNMTYRYSINQTSYENNTVRNDRILGNGSVSLLDNESVTIPFECTMDEPLRTRIRITLLDRNESIHFWLEPVDISTLQNSGGT